MAAQRRDPRAAEALDRRLGAPEARAAAQLLRVPRQGWVRAVRTALGMSGRQLGERLGVSGSAVAQMEASERGGTVSLAKLRAAAEAMDCELVYGFVPRHSLASLIDDQARLRAGAVLVSTHRHMALEDQEVEVDAAERLLAELTERWKASARLWDGEARREP